MKICNNKNIGGVSATERGLNANNRPGRSELDSERFQQVPNKLINDLRLKRLKPIDIPVFVVLLDHARSKEACYPSLETIGRLVGCNKRSVSRSLERLANSGHIERHGKSKAGTRMTWINSRANTKRNDSKDGKAKDYLLHRSDDRDDAAIPTSGNDNVDPTSVPDSYGDECFLDFDTDLPRMHEDDLDSDDRSSTPDFSDLDF